MSTTKNSLSLVFGALVLVSVPAVAQWKFTPSLGGSEAFDDNIYLQNQGPLAHQQSMVSTVSPALSLSRTQGGEWTTTLLAKYSPDFVVFHSESEENHIKHNIAANYGGKSAGWSFDLANSITVIDGSDTGPTFTAPGAIPAMGGVPIRDRRDAAIYKMNYKIQYTSGPWMVRPQFAAYIHDFQTKHESTPGYENYVDRSDFGAGVDMGYKVSNETYLIVGYRYGWQHQAELLDSPIEYSNLSQRLIFGLEGKPLPWIKLAVFAGPDWRSFNGHPVDGFETEQCKVYVDSTVTLSPTKDDEITLLMKQFLQPSYCGRAIYEDTTYQLTYRHKFSEKLSGTLTLRDYGGDWENPSTRSDRIYTLGVGACYQINTHFTAEAGYTFDSAESNVPDTAGREFDRSLVFVSLKYAF